MLKVAVLSSIFIMCVIMGLVKKKDLYFRKKEIAIQKKRRAMPSFSQPVEKPSCGSSRSWVFNQYGGKARAEKERM